MKKSIVLIPSPSLIKNSFVRSFVLSLSLGVRYFFFSFSFLMFWVFELRALVYTCKLLCEVFAIR